MIGSLKYKHFLYAIFAPVVKNLFRAVLRRFSPLLRESKASGLGVFTFSDRHERLLNICGTFVVYASCSLCILSLSLHQVCVLSNVACFVFGKGSIEVINRLNLIEITRFACGEQRIMCKSCDVVLHFLFTGFDVHFGKGTWRRQGRRVWSQSRQRSQRKFNQVFKH